MVEKKQVQSGPYTGPERREYCAQHCSLSAAARNSVPRWAFISSLSTMIILALVFAGWHVTSLTAMEISLQSRIMEYKTHFTNRLTDANVQYGKDIGRLIQAVGENRQVLKEVSRDIGDIKVTQGQIVTKQELVLEKVHLSNGGED